MTEIWDFEKFGENVALISDTGEKLTYKKLKSRIAEVRIQNDKKGDEWGGVLHTGDMGYLDEEGYLYVRGRKDRCKKILGKRINLDELQILISRNVEAELYLVSKNDIIEFVSQDTVDKDDVIAYLRKLKIPTSHVRVRMLLEW